MHQLELFFGGYLSEEATGSADQILANKSFVEWNI
jgi:hypothetical protein